MPNKLQAPLQTPNQAVMDYFTNFPFNPISVAANGVSEPAISPEVEFLWIRLKGASPIMGLVIDWKYLSPDSSQPYQRMWAKRVEESTLTQMLLSWSGGTPEETYVFQVPSINTQGIRLKLTIEDYVSGSMRIELGGRKLGPTATT